MLKRGLRAPQKKLCQLLLNILLSERGGSREQFAIQIKSNLEKGDILTIKLD